MTTSLEEMHAIALDLLNRWRESETALIEECAGATRRAELAELEARYEALRLHMLAVLHGEEETQ